MGITLGSNFTVNTNLPLDDRIIVADTTARDAIASGRRYEGLLVYVLADATNYQLVGGITNGDWIELSGSGGGILSFADTTARDALDAGDRTEGMIVYVEADETHYTLKGGITNGDWTSLVTTANYIVDSFNGTGSQTAFTLTSDPASENNTFVYVSGVYQEKDTYSVSGTTLTFSEAPPLGTSNIEVVYSVPLSIGAPADGTVTTAKIVDSNVTTAKIADGAVTLAKMTGNYQESSSIPNVGITATSYSTVSGSSLSSFVHPGGDVEFGLTQGNTLGNLQEVRVLATGSVDTVYVEFVVRDVTNSANLAITRQGNRFSASSSQHIVYLSPGCFTTTVRNLAAGTYDFELRAAVSTSNSAVFNNVKFYARGKK